jgi:uncharacterized protein
MPVLLWLFLVALVCGGNAIAAGADGAATPRSFAIAVGPDDVIPTGNEWIALPTIRAADGALMNFNVLSMRDRGLLQVSGKEGSAVVEPYFVVGGKRLAIKNPSWRLIEYWIPRADIAVDGLSATVTYCAPPGFRAAFVSLTLTNNGKNAVPVALGLHASWGALQRVTYTPVVLKGERSVGPAAWEKSAEVFSFVTHDTQFAWSIDAPDSDMRVVAPPVSAAPEVDAQRIASLAPGATLEAHFVIGAGLEEYSASQSASALTETMDRIGVEALLRQGAEWCKRRTRTTGQEQLDLIMNRNLLFTAMYAWGRTLDTEELVGITSRSPRYYVSAAYWDRDAMLWSFPGLLDVDPELAGEALNYALTRQLRNAGVHSRFIDGVVLEDGFELDEAVAPIIALENYVRMGGHDEFLSEHRAALQKLKAELDRHFDAAIGLYSTLQDAQDQYRKQAFSTYDNVLVWKALLDFAELSARLNDVTAAEDAKRSAEALRKEILERCVSSAAPGASGAIFVSATDAKDAMFADVPPGSLMKLPALEFISEDDPLFQRTYDWLHSKSYAYSYSDESFGLPGSYRLPFTTSWSVADHLKLKLGRAQALKILLSSSWDGGVISEGVNPATAIMDYDGRAFATAAGYVGHAICVTMCR